MNYEKCINKAILKIGKLEKGKVFILKNLFSGVVWEEMTSGQRKEFGRQFKNKVENKMIPNVKLSNKKRSATAYEKI